MTRLLPFPAASRELPFAGIAHTAAAHFRLALFGAVAQLMEACAGGDRPGALAAFPFLADYAEELADLLRQPQPTAEGWRATLAAWEDSAAGDAALPLRALAGAGLGALERELVLAAGLVEEDPRFGDLFEHATGRSRRPTAGLLLAWWRADATGADRAEEARRAVLDLVQLGLLQAVNDDAPRSEWVLSVPAPLWDALRGQSPALPWLRHLKRTELSPLDLYVAPAAVLRCCHELPNLLAASPRQLLVVRGAARNGRRTMLGGVARALGKDLLLADATAAEDAGKWRMLGTLGVMLDAMPAVELPLAPGENRTLPMMSLAAGPIAVVTGPRGGVQCEPARSLVTVELPLPDPASRRRLWQCAALGQDPVALDHLARSTRLGSGTIGRVARAAAGYAQLDGRAAIGLDDVRRAARALHPARLERVATRLEVSGSLRDLAVDEPTRAELALLAARCRHREALAEAASAGGDGGVGVRALLTGPSGTGKTLAARLLAVTLEKDLFRVDLAATVDKYLGETEKNLDQAFAAAEELDVVLLLDEGDALMAARTDVGSSNDRYANLETNFLLQRIETFEGILLVTSNAAERIDKAFARRMDVVIAFRPPDELRRYEILRMHLAGQPIDDALLQEVAYRCVLTGGQLRNVAQHAQLLALDAARSLSGAHLRAALQREYRKTGAHCPLKPASDAGAG
jgi:hypothetical protein